MQDESTGEGSHQSSLRQGTSGTPHLASAPMPRTHLAWGSPCTELQLKASARVEAQWGGHTYQAEAMAWVAVEERTAMVVVV